MIEIEFNQPNENNKYRVFDNNFEEDPNILFHGTAASNLDSIIKNGFRVTRELASISFAHESGLALNYACNSRNEASPCGVIIAVRFDSLDAPGIRKEGFGIHWGRKGVTH